MSQDHVSHKRGIFAAAISALMFGISPILCKMIFLNGGNPITVTSMRSLLALPVLLLILRVRDVSLHVSRQEILHILAVGIPGVTLTAVLLSASYLYISSGLATTLHFIYPALTALGERFFFGEHMSGRAAIALVFIMCGVILFAQNTVASQPLGIVLALLSGFTYTYYILYISHSPLAKMDTFKLTFYCCLVMAASTGVWGLITGGIATEMSAIGWALTAVNAVGASLGGVALFQLGVQLAGPSATAMMSALEPATSVVLGVLIFADPMRLPELAGCLAVCLGIFLLVPGQVRTAVGLQGENANR